MIKFVELSSIFYMNSQCGFIFIIQAFYSSLVGCLKMINLCIISFDKFIYYCKLPSEIVKNTIFFMTP